MENVADQILPDLATCSYQEFQRSMGTPVRISLGIRGQKLPNPKFYADSRTQWIYLSELAPGRDYFKADDAEFDRRYLAQLDQYAADIEQKLIDVAAVNAVPLVLLCYEVPCAGPADCHRRLFADWWTARTGADVPELGRTA